MVTMPKHVVVKEVKNTSDVELYICRATEALMYQNDGINDVKATIIWPFLGKGYEIWMSILKGQTAIWGLLMVGAEEKEVIYRVVKIIWCGDLYCLLCIK